MGTLALFLRTMHIDLAEIYIRKMVHKISIHSHTHTHTRTHTHIRTTRLLITQLYTWQVVTIAEARV